MESLRVLNVAAGFTGIVLCSLGMLQALLSKKVYDRSERYVLPTYACLIVFAASNLAGQLMRGRPGDWYRAGLYLSNFLEFLAPSLAVYIMSRYLLSLVDPRKERRAARIALLVLLLTQVALLVISQFTGLYYVIDPENVYRRGAWFPLSQAFAAAMLLIDLVLLFRDRGSALTKKATAAFCIYFATPLLTVGIQAFVYGVYYNVIATIIAVLTMHVFLFTDQTERYYRQREEISRLRVEILLSQIQPHFLYNTLSTIQALCRTDPEQAFHITQRFGIYLRQNLDALSQTELIPVSKELEHTRVYAEIEETRFPNVHVEYDAQDMDFLLPALTIQPLVENAIRHGVRIRDNGAVTVSTRRADGFHEIVIRDNGKGFDPELPGERGETHIGIRNVRERVERMCRGTVELESAVGSGTTVTIRIPA